MLSFAGSRRCTPCAPCQIEQIQRADHFERRESDRRSGKQGAHAEGNFGPLKLNLWVRNLTDTKYNTFVVQSGATGQTLSFAQLGNPFQLGIDLKYHF